MMKPLVFFFISFAITSFANGLLSLIPSFWERTNPLDLSPAQMSIINRTASSKEKIVIFIFQFLGSILNPLIYVIAGIATVIFSVIK